MSMSFNKGGDGRPRGFGFGGFSIPRKGGASDVQMGYGITTGVGGRNYGVSSNLGKKRVKSEEEYVNLYLKNVQSLYSNYHC